MVSVRRNTNIEVTYGKNLRNLLSTFKKMGHDDTRSAITAVSVLRRKRKQSAV